MSQDLSGHLAAMLGGDAGIGYEKITDGEGLRPEEAKAIRRAIPARQAEFAAGRRAARAALTALGFPETSIPMGRRRAPEWPGGLLGSITHDAGLAMAAVMRDADAAGLGIDLTEAAPLPGDTRKAILPHGSEAALDPLAARIGFSAKETLFKALYPQIGVFFGFSAADVRPDLATGTFDIRLCDPLGDMPAGTEWRGRFVICEDRILTALIIG